LVVVAQEHPLVEDLGQMELTVLILCFLPLLQPVVVEAGLTLGLLAEEELLAGRVVRVRVRNQDKHQQVVLELQIKDLLEETEQLREQRLGITVAAVAALEERELLALAQHRELVVMAALALRPQ
jgi:hypothetical protein